MAFVAVSSCSEKLEVLQPRKTIESIPTDQTSDEISGGGLLLEDDLYSPAKFMGACAWLDSLSSKTRDDEQGFRILEDFGVRSEDSGWKGPFGDDTRLPFFKRKKKEEDPGRDTLDLANLYGRVQLNDNPLYEYGLAQKNREIPDRDTFYKLVNKEVGSSPIMILPLVALQTSMRLGLINPYKKRNEIIQEQIADSLPGIFDTEGQLYRLKETFPEILVKNGAPFAEILKPLPNDSVQESEKKATELKKVLSVLSKRLPMFRERNWSSFRDDMRWGLSAGIRGMQSTNPIEQACGAAIFHRGFAQMLSVKGYDRPPLERARTVRGSSRWVLVDTERFLDSPKGNQLRACPGVGSFTREGRSTQVQDSELADTSGESTLVLASTPQPIRSCVLENSRVLKLSKAQPTVWGMKRPDMKAANLEQKLDFMAGVSYFLMAFSPGSRWWFGDAGVVAYPLADFGADKKLKDILASGGLLPYEAFALSLGFLNLAGNNLIDQHLMYIDKQNKEVSGDGEVFGVRIANKPRKSFDKSIVVTEVHSVLLLSDVIFKLHETLANMSHWFAQTEKQIDAEILKNPNSPDAVRMKKDFEIFVSGLFGSRETLVMLTEDGEDSVRKKIDDFRLALSLLMARFIKPVPTKNAAGKNVYSCYAQLRLDPVTGIEEQLGSCADSVSQGLQAQSELFRQSMRLVGRAFQSPLYLEYGQHP